MADLNAINCPGCGVPLAEVGDAAGPPVCDHCGLALELRPVRPRGDAPKPVPLIPDALAVEECGGNLRIRWRWFSCIGIVLLPVGLALCGFALASLSRMPHRDDASLPFVLVPLGFLAGGGSLTYFALLLLVNRTTVRLGDGAYSATAGPLPFYRGIRLAADEIEQIYCQKRKLDAGQNNLDHTHSYRLLARLRSGEVVPLVQGVWSSDTALAVEYLLERHLGLEDRRVAGDYAG